jgi:D-glycero-alpha-D-manno-heptose-7-phosphate kinase
MMYWNIGEKELKHIPRFNKVIKKTVLTRAPHRISFAGGGSDFPNFYSLDDGYIFSTTINRYSYIFSTYHSTSFLEKFRLNYSESELSNRVDTIKNEIVREALKYCNRNWGPVESLTIHISSEIPGSSGLGSSSVVTSAILMNLAERFEISLSEKELVNATTEIELHKLGKSMGVQDQYITCFGGTRLIKFSKNGTESQKFPVEKLLQLLEGRLFLISTKKFRQAEKILANQNNPSSIQREILKDMASGALDLYETLLNAEETEARLKLITEVNRQMILKSNISEDITSNGIHEWLSQVKSKGFDAVKVAGAGGGGFIVGITNKNFSKDDIDKISLELDTTIERVSPVDSKVETILVIND